MRTTGNAITESPFGAPAKNAVAPPYGVKYQGDKAKSYLAKELGLEIQYQRNQAHLEALLQPKDWLDKYNDMLDGVLTRLTEDLKQKTANYSQVYPMDQAVALAQRDIALIFEIEKRQLDIQFPGSELLFKSAENVRDAVRTATGGTGFLDSVAHDAKADKAAYKRYKKHKKSKKAKKTETA